MGDPANCEYEYLGYFMLNIFHRRFFDDNTITADILEREFETFARENDFFIVQGPVIDRLLANNFISFRHNSTVKFKKHTLHTFRNKIMQILEMHQRNCRNTKKESVVFEEYTEAAGVAELLPGSKIVQLTSDREFLLNRDESSSSESDETDDSSSGDESDLLPETNYSDNLVIKCQICKCYELLHFDVKPQCNVKVQVQKVTICREVSGDEAVVTRYCKTLSVLRHRTPFPIGDGFSFVVRNNLFETLTYGKINVTVSYKLYIDHEEKFIRENHMMQEERLLRPFYCSPKTDKGLGILSVYPSPNVEMYCQPGNHRQICWDPKFVDYLSRNKTVTPLNFCVAFRTLLEMEDMANINLYKRFVQRGVHVERDFNTETTLKKRDELEDNFAYRFSLISGRRKYFAAMDALTAGDHVIFMDWKTSYILENHYAIYTGIDMMKKHNLYKGDSNVKLFFSRIEDVTDHGVVFLLQRAKVLDSRIQYDVHFTPQRENYLMQYKALQNLTQNSHLMGLLFPTGRSADGEVGSLSLELFNSSISANPQQYEGVKRIVSKKNSTIPYIIFGPPGTGKTTTLVEAVLQLWKADRNNFILIVAGSNACCDEIGIRLAKTFMEVDRYGRNMIRVYSKSARKKYLYDGKKTLDPILKVMSNLCRNKHSFPEPIQLETYKIVVCTLAVVGRYAYRLGKSFTHVFIDECGASTEPEVVTGLSGLISKKTVVVLAGDPKQLGPVITSEDARLLGFDVSTLERIMKADCYYYNQSTMTYDRTIQIRLVRNFRTHSKILRMSNELYYNNQLQYMADERITHWAIGYYELPTSDFPIILHEVEGTCSQRLDGTSFCNNAEVEVIVKYVKELMFFGVRNRRLKESDIGIISPYKYQVFLIKEELRKLNWVKIEVGPVEVFQGQEKPIIIFSTVRSSGRNIGFVGNSKRINVSLTRAQALLIIVGNPNTLNTNGDFRFIIDYCTRNGAYKRSSNNQILNNDQLLERIRCLFVFTHDRLRR